VQGHLRNEHLSVEIETKCSHCDLLLHLTLDSLMQVSVREQAARPLVFMPEVDWEHFTGRTIIDSY